MNTSDFARRHGYREDPIVFEATDFLPLKVRTDAGIMMVESFERLIEPDVFELRNSRGDSAWPHRHAYRRFAEVLRDSLPASESLLSWYQFVTQYAFVSSTATKDGVCQVLVQPLLECDWQVFYEIVENVRVVTWRSSPKSEYDFEPEFNFLLKAHRIPWELHGGLVIPAADSELAKELEHALLVDHPRVADHVSDPHELIREALAALYRKQPGPDFKAAVSHARDAWRSVVGAVSGCNPEEDAKRAFALIKDRYPELNATMKAWNDLINAERHPANANQRFPTDAEARFIVMLCVNAVRFLCPTCDAGNDALI